MRLKSVLLIAIVLVLTQLSVLTVWADEPTPAPTGVESPEELPPLPEKLPTDLADLLPWIEVVVLFGAGIAVNFLTDLSKSIPWVGKQQNENVRKQIVRLVSVLASLLIAVLMPYAGEAVRFLTDSGIYTTLLTILSVQFGTYRFDKLLRAAIAKLFYQNPSVI